mgnify:CR=1 FL=1
MPISKTVELVPFDQIEVIDYFEVFLVEDSFYSAEIVGDAQIIEHVDLKVKNNTLFIENKRKAKWISPRKNKIKVYVSSLPLKQVTAEEGCNIQTLSPITSIEFGLILKGKSNEANLELDGNTFYYWNSFPSGGKLSLSGKTEILKIWNFAIMSVDAKALIAKKAIIVNRSKGDCETTVLNKLEYSINGEGNIQLYGNPLDIINNGISSSGKLIQH